MKRSKLNMHDSVSASNLTLPKSRPFVAAKAYTPTLRVGGSSRSGICLNTTRVYHPVTWLLAQYSEMRKSFAEIIGSPNANILSVYVLLIHNTHRVSLTAY
jgi:hypothetical protein